jgi:hypothetical protein
MAVQSPDLPAGKPQTQPSGRAREVIFSFDDLTWAAAQERGMCFPQDQLALAMLDDPAIEKLLLCDRPRSAPIKLAKDLIERPLRFESSLRVDLWQPLRWRRLEPVSVKALERTYATYDRRLQRVAERRGLDRPAVITGQPFIAAFAKLEWAGPVTLFSTDDLAAHPDYQRWRPSLLTAYERIAASRRRVCAVTEAIIERIGPQGRAGKATGLVHGALRSPPALRWRPRQSHRYGGDAGGGASIPPGHGCPGRPAGRKGAPGGAAGRAQRRPPRGGATRAGGRPLP